MSCSSLLTSKLRIITPAFFITSVFWSIIISFQTKKLAAEKETNILKVSREKPFQLSPSVVLAFGESNGGVALSHLSILVNWQRY